MQSLTSNRCHQYWCLPLCVLLYLFLLSIIKVVSKAYPVQVYCVIFFIRTIRLKTEIVPKSTTNAELFKHFFYIYLEILQLHIFDLTVCWDICNISSSIKKCIVPVLFVFYPICVCYLFFIVPLFLLRFPHKTFICHLPNLHFKRNVGDRFTGGDYKSFLELTRTTAPTTKSPF